MDCDTHTYVRLTEAETNKLRHSLDDALTKLRALDDGVADADEDDGVSMNTFSDVLDAVSGSTIETSAQLNLLYDIIDYLGGDKIHPDDIEMDVFCPHYRALAALGRHVMAERRAANAAFVGRKGFLDS